MVIVDTNLIIDHLRQKERADSILASLSLQYPKGELSVSTVTIQELFAEQSTKRTKELEKIARTISSLIVIDYNTSIAKTAGELTRDYAMTFADAAIAATTLHYNAKLATLNPKDFSSIPHLTLLPL